MKIKMSEILQVQSNVQDQYVDLLKLRDKINNLLSMTEVSMDLLKLICDIGLDNEDSLYAEYLENQVDVLHEALILENEVQEAANEMESYAIYGHIITGKDYPEALYAIKFQIDPESAGDEPPVFYGSEPDFYSDELDEYYESYGDPADYVLGYTGSPNTVLMFRDEPVQLIFNDDRSPLTITDDFWRDDDV